MTAAHKIRLSLGRLTFEFATASELRDALLASFADAEYAGGPFVMVNRDDTAPAWSWVIELVRKRSDWWPALGVALQHASNGGGDMARRALADLLAKYHETLVLLEWTRPLALRWPDATADSSWTTWGRPDFRLDRIVADQVSAWSRRIADAHGEVFLDGCGSNGSAITGALTDSASLQTLLAKSAKAGGFPDGKKGPWTWLVDEVLFRPWLPTLVPGVVASFASGTDREVRAMLDWFSDEWELWRFVDLFDSWRGTPPDWSNEPADSKPTGWRYNMRSAHWPNVKTLGDVALECLRRAQAQAATPTVLDLSPLA